MSVVTAFSLSKKTFDELEKNRGLIPRSTYVEKILSDYFEKNNTDAHHGAAISLRLAKRRLT